ncbi:MAG: hypothetical protein ACRC62_20100 [Microcoleus sp.]
MAVAARTIGTLKQFAKLVFLCYGRIFQIALDLKVGETMNYKRLIAASAVIFIFALLWNSLIHGIILRDANAAIAGIARSAAERPMGLALLLTAGLAFLFVWSYAYAARRGTWREGMAHGLFFALLAGLFVNLNQYVLYPIPAALTLTTKQNLKFGNHRGR